MTTEQLVGWSIAAACAFGGGYWFGADHTKTEYETRAKFSRQVLPQKCLCGLTEQKLRNITWQHCKKVKS